MQASAAAEGALTFTVGAQGAVEAAGSTVLRQSAERAWLETETLATGVTTRGREREHLLKRMAEPATAFSSQGTRGLKFRGPTQTERPQLGGNAR